MENKKEPLMSAEEYFDLNIDKYNKYSEIMEAYAKYVLNNAKEFVADEVKILDYTVLENWIDLATPSIDKQSIHTAIDNYIEINLNKEL